MLSPSLTKTVQSESGLISGREINLKLWPKCTHLLLALRVPSAVVSTSMQMHQQLSKAARFKERLGVGPPHPRRQQLPSCC